MNGRLALHGALVLAIAAAVTACSGGPERTSDAGAAVTSAPAASPSPSVMRPEPVEHTVIPVGHAPHRVTAAGGAVWVAGGTGSVHQVAPRAGTAHWCGTPAPS